MTVTQVERWSEAQAHTYWEQEGLGELVKIYNDEAPANPYYATDGSAQIAFAPRIPDLVRLHALVRQRGVQTVLEFGVGFSTVVLADALEKNERDFAALPEKPAIRNKALFQLYSVDASSHWLKAAEKRIPENLKSRCHLSYSRVIAGTFNGRLCHYYEALPNVIADFIYLDGPSPKQVEGKINGLDFSIDERTVMSADLLLMEPSFLPGLYILVDGRTNNARFLQRNFQRPFKHSEYPDADISTFELQEPPLGRYNHSLASYFSQLKREIKGDRH